MYTIQSYRKECNKHGYSCEDLFGDIVIKTKYEKWKFTPSDGKTCLYHGNCNGRNYRSKNDYHIEFREYISPESLIKYIHEHENAKYTNRVYKEFSIHIDSKKRQYNKKKLRELESMLL